MVRNFEYFQSVPAVHLAYIVSAGRTHIIKQVVSPAGTSFSNICRREQSVQNVSRFDEAQMLVDHSLEVSGICVTIWKVEHIQAENSAFSASFKTSEH